MPELFLSALPFLFLVLSAREELHQKLKSDGLSLRHLHHLSKRAFASELRIPVTVSMPLEIRTLLRALTLNV